MMIRKDTWGVKWGVKPEFLPIERVTPRLIVIRDYWDPVRHWGTAGSGKVDRIAVRLMLDRKRLETGEVIHRSRDPRTMADRGGRRPDHADYRLVWIVDGKEVTKDVWDFFDERGAARHEDLSDPDKIMLHLFLSGMHP